MATIFIFDGVTLQTSHTGSFLRAFNITEEDYPPGKEEIAHTLEELGIETQASIL